MVTEKQYKVLNKKCTTHRIPELLSKKQMYRKLPVLLRRYITALPSEHTEVKLFDSPCSVGNSVDIAGFALLVGKKDSDYLPQKSSLNPMFPWLERFQH